MPNIDFQRHSFLGGEVSPRLYERADMDKFGRWFSKAENIRFHETGGFRNRPGFVKVAATKNNLSGEIVKLIAFQFNDEESFLVELGPNYARFYKNGKLITVNGSAYELETAFNSFTEDDLKYAQAGDTIFITHPTYGIYELARLKVDGTQWEIKKFNTDVLPMAEENDDETSTVSLAQASISNAATITLTQLNGDNTVTNPRFYEGDTLKLELTGDIALGTLLTNMQNALNSENISVSLSGNTFLFSVASSTTTIPSFSLTYGFLQDKTVSKTVYPADYGWSTVFYNPDHIGSLTFSFGNEVAYVKKIEGSNLIKFSNGGSYSRENYSYGATDTSSLSASLASIAAQNGAITSTNNSLTIKTTVYTNGSSSAILWYYGPSTNPFNAKVTYVSTTSAETTVKSVASTSNSTLYNLTSTKDLFSEDMLGETILVKHEVESQMYHAALGVGSTTNVIGPTNGYWRLYSTGNWTGTVTLQYSIDNQQTWVDYRKFASDSTSLPSNINTEGTVTGEDTIYFRILTTVGSVGSNSALNITLSSNSYAINSYYKILSVTSSKQVLVDCIKNDVGTFTNNAQWRLQAFSKTKGWPQTIGFYQNRLFFGKDYTLYGSKTNDFWDFYEPISLSADDPVTMSLLSAKVNIIKNIVTQRSFFAFTGGGEFGIGSEGALTQADKYLKPFSSNGSAVCNPVLISDVILFVDKSNNSIRALKYSLESDGYEAPDITLVNKQLMEAEKIISSDTLFNSKEALFLSSTGTIWVLKYITDQNVLAWSHWKHAYGKITNICVVPNGAEQELYITVEYNGGKHIEKLDNLEWMDSVEYFRGDTAGATINVSGDPGDIKAILYDNVREFATLSEDGTIPRPDTVQDFKVGTVYHSTATLLSPVVQSSEYSHNTFEVKKPFKVYFYYLDSYGFKVGVEENEKMAIEWQPSNADIDDENSLTSGKKSVLIPSRFDGSARVSFVQDEPYPMDIEDVLIKVDYGGK